MCSHTALLNRLVLALEKLFLLDTTLIVVYEKKKAAAKLDLLSYKMFLVKSTCFDSETLPTFSSYISFAHKAIMV